MYNKILSPMRSKLCLIVFLISIRLTCYGQINKGQWLIGGNLDLYVYDEFLDGSNFSKISFSILPTVGYFPISNLSVGVQPVIYKSFFYEEGANDKSLIMAIGPFLRYYFLDSKKIINPLFEASYKRGVFKDFRGIPRSGKYVSYSVGLGFAAFLTEYASIEVIPEFWYQFTGLPTVTYERTGLRTTVGLKIHL